MKKKHLLFLVLFWQTLFFNSHAAIITVTNSADNVVGGLRFAIESAGAGDTIVFSASLAGGIISLTPEVIVIDKDLTIIGPGEDQLSISNNRTNTVFVVEESVSMYLSGIKIEWCGDYLEPMQNGLSGAIYSQGNLTVEDANFYVNSSGAIYSTGVLNLIRVSFTSNYTKGYNYPGRCAGITSSGTATIKDCFFDTNGSDGGAGNTGSIQNSGTMVVENTSVVNGWSQVDEYNVVAAISNTGNLQLINCTISNCRTSGKGYPGAGGIYNAGDLSIEYCTIAYNVMSNTNYPDVFFNHPDYFLYYKGSGIYNTGNLSLRGSIIAQNGQEELYMIHLGPIPVVEAGIDVLSTGSVNDLGYNFIGVNDGLNLTASTNIFGTSLEFKNSRLEPLRNNGGSSPTHALKDGSQCIDAGGNSTILYDQRGEKRRNPDIGAYEYKNVQMSYSMNYRLSSSYAPSTITFQNSFEYRKPILVVSHVPGYRKLKLGYDTIGLYHANKNVLEGGNTTLEITLKSYYSGVEWDKIQVRPNGSVVNPVSLGNYLSGTVSSQRTIKIPLSDFDPSIDFSHLILLEFPYSNNAGYFKLGIEKIIFTGGSTPFLWFGDSKINNIFDGGGVGGQLLASAFSGGTDDNVEKVEFFYNNIKIGETSSPPFTYNWTNVGSGYYYRVRGVAHTTYGEQFESKEYTINVKPAPQRESSLLESESLNHEYVYPNPTTDFITIKSLNSNAQVVIRDINGVIQYQETYSNLQNNQANISFLPSGLYFLKLEDEENPFGKVIKLIKQ